MRLPCSLRVPPPNVVYYEVTLLPVCLCRRPPIVAKQLAACVPPPNSFVFYAVLVVQRKVGD
jgi:hypothetical protein